MTRRIYRTLKPGERIPDGPSHRYREGLKRYIKLRWKIGTNKYVETYEHRVLQDGTVTTAQHVHHRNGTRDDNSPDNLEPTTQLRHHEQHASYDIGEAIALYRSGVTVAAIARRYGVHYSSVLRRFQRRGIYGRRPDVGKRLQTHCIRGHELTPDAVQQYGNHRPCKKCRSELSRKRRLLTKPHVKVTA